MPTKRAIDRRSFVLQVPLTKQEKARLERQRKPSEFLSETVRRLLADVIQDTPAKA